MRSHVLSFLFFCNDTATTEIYTLSLHDALPITLPYTKNTQGTVTITWTYDDGNGNRSEEHTSELQSRFDLVCRLLREKKKKRTAQQRVYPAGQPFATQRRAAGPGPVDQPRQPFFFLMIRRPPRSTLFTYPPLFR